MREFHFDNDEDFQDQEEAEFLYEVEPPMFGTGQMFPVDLITSNFNHQTLATAIQICEKSWFWRFKTLKKKLESIIQTYVVLQELFESE